jgi:heptosyltransferase-2
VKALVIKVAAIGDFLMATPALRALRQDPRISAVDLLAGRSIAAAVSGNPDVGKVFFLDDRRIFHGSLPAKALEVLRICRRLRRERYDVGFNFHRDWRFSIILFLAGCRRRIGFARGRRTFLLTDAVPVAGIKHHIFHYCDLLKPLGVLCMDFKMVFPLDAAQTASARAKFLAAANLDDYIVLAPGGAANVKEEMASRRWPVEGFSALAGMLLRSGRRVVLLGSGGDAVIADRIRAENPGVVDLTRGTTLAEAAALLQKARLAVCNDSGLMHLAAAVGTPVISIFGPTHPGEKKPLQAGSVAVWKGEGMECSPCYHDGVFPACDHLSCLRRITAQEIFELIAARP